jgi:fermentation-respiration switch protein FrsA (DUF1100 family)
MFRIIILTIASIFFYVHVSAQQAKGTWSGKVNVRGTELQLVIHVSDNSSPVEIQLDSPDQGVYGMKADEATIEGNVLTAFFKNAGLRLEGLLRKDGKIMATIEQGSNRDEISFERVSPNPTFSLKSARPQEPKAPFPYDIQEVRFTNTKEQIELAGTLCIPKGAGPFPAAILISGSGPQDRDESILGHKPFWVLADHLTRQGIAVLRYDDRGVAASKGNFASSTTLQFSEDAAAAFDFLSKYERIKPSAVGLIGHSEGGIIAPIVAANRKKVAFIILMAGTGIPGDSLLLLQQTAILEADSASSTEIENTRSTFRTVFSTIRNTKNIEDRNKQIRMNITASLQNGKMTLPEGINQSQYVEMQATQLANPWMLQFLTLNPADYLKKVRCPVLALNGSKDTQVPFKENLDAIKKAITHANPLNEYKVMDGLNHLFQHCNTGSPSEYKNIEETLAPEAMEAMTKWIQTTVK